MMADLVIQGVVLGQILENPQKLGNTPPEMFSDADLAGIIAGLHQDKKNTTLLQAWLRQRGVDWDGNGRAIEAVRSAVGAQSAFDRCESIRRKARYLLPGSPSNLRSQLEYLLEQIPKEGSTDASHSSGDGPGSGDAASGRPHSPADSGGK